MKTAVKYNFLFTDVIKRLDIETSVENRITYFHCCLFLVMLPFDRFYSQLVLISLVLHTLIHLSGKKLQACFTRRNLVLSSVFLLTLAGTAWSDNKTEALKEIERQSAILLFPFLLSVTGLDINKYRKKLLLLFGATCLVTVLYLYVDAFRIILYYQLSVKSLVSPAFLNHNFSAPIHLHASYLSMYIALSIASFLYYFSSESDKRIRLLYIAAVVILLAGLISLASRSVVIAMVIICSFGFSFFIVKNTKKYQSLIISICVSMLTFFLIAKIETLHKRYITGFKTDLALTSMEDEIADPRILRWNAALSVIQQSWLAGHGSGTEKKLLKEVYFDNKLYNSYLHELNAHNQYLSMLIKTGIIGLAVFLLTLWAGFVSAWRNRDFIFFSFMTIITIVSFSENIVDVNKGIFFYSFFFSFFLLPGKSFARLSKK
jgi:O-antigen ligase